MNIIPALVIAVNGDAGPRKCVLQQWQLPRSSRIRSFETPPTEGAEQSGGSALAAVRAAEWTKPLV